MLDALRSEFALGLWIGLVVALLIIIANWIKNWKLRRTIREQSRQDEEHLKLLSRNFAETSAELQQKIHALQKQVDNQKVTIEQLQEKPDRKDLRELRLYAQAYVKMLEQAPGFAQAWQLCVREIEQEEKEAALGYRIFVRPLQRLHTMLGGKPARQALPGDAAIPETRDGRSGSKTA